jgi:tRNA pseudouridine32 synthase/23S rRNA pseudouridine746 synthase
MPVTPAGDYVERSLLVRLQKSTGIETLSPAHRLDRDTAGLVLFVINPQSRAAYHGLFARGEVEREYLAAARVGDSTPVGTNWQVSNRLGAGEPWYRQRIVEGLPNAHTHIELIERKDGVGRFRIRPTTGKQHQIRVHMSSLGFPILGDSIYGDGPGPLQLLAQRLTFGGRTFYCRGGGGAGRAERGGGVFF